MIRIGPAGWSYPDWEGRVYPQDASRRFDRLAYLATYFDTIEINSTCYRIPDPKMAASWATPVESHPRFTFTAKLPQLFTHMREPDRQAETAFKRAMEPLQAAGRLGALLLQFPYSFHDTPANRGYLTQLVHQFRGYPLVLEIRHRSWDRPQVYEFLQELGVGFCHIDQPQVSYAIGLTRVVTSSIGYLRLHGRNASAWFQENVGRDERYHYRYSEEELNEILNAVEIIARRARDTYLWRLDYIGASA